MIDAITRIADDLHAIRQFLVWYKTHAEKHDKEWKQYMADHDRQMAVLDEQVFGKSSAKRKGKSKLKVVTIRPKGHGK